ncbi:MAG: PEP-CTERM sorting domain-containing protein, partial [Planctomycetota bacterium]
TTDVTIDSGYPLGSSLSVGPGKTLTAVGGLHVGTASAGSLSISGGIVVDSVSGQVGAAAPVSATVTLQGANTAWTMTGDLTVHSVNTADVTVGQGATLANANAFVASVPGTTADIDVSGADTEWNSTGSVYLGGGAGTLGGPGRLDLAAGAAMTVGGDMVVWDSFDVVVANSQVNLGTSLLIRGSLKATGTSILDAAGTDVQVARGRLDGVLTGDGSTNVSLADGGDWTTTGPIEVAAAPAGAGNVGSLALTAGTSVTTTGSVLVQDAARFTLGGGTITAASFDFGGEDLTDHGTLNGDVAIGGDVVATGDLTLGDPASYTGVQIGGGLDVGAHTVTLRKAGFFNIGMLTNIAGGTLDATGGVSIPAGNSVVAFGAITGRIAAEAGSTIDAVGDLSLGDASSLAGFTSAGELKVNRHTVVLLDANEAVLGSLTTIGDAGRWGTLTAANGSLLGFGRNLSGYGYVHGDFVNNGYVLGQGTGGEGQRLEFTGTVSGVGSFGGDVHFSGVYSPGLSTAAVEFDGNVSFASGSTVRIELGGREPGSQHDQLNVAGLAELDGTLDISLINGFVPAVGDEIEVLTCGSRSGRFAAVEGWHLRNGLALVTLNEEMEFFLHCTYMGDATLDGQVGIADLAALADNYGLTIGAAWGRGDFNVDGIVGIADLAVLADNYGRKAESPVPEPAGVSLLALGAMALFRRRRK